ncbi:MAG: glutamate--tRNA ligase [Alphaproteobacteria bacterium RIFCSPHIGHO2_12_FULL_45_9]|nr:MAG: glutamate--tRNA ligase [Alphaproteobacteria bacterium RIFCSPHIGHO2_02_FULL_46_13]OFW94572.1 MAG: glutamate--tRNA ligase [Alphaproteobacteria bacterium RIFCSPHIGHO2_12_FULL_45_9]
MTIVTRFPPSPTGFMHIGTARTGLFNWLFAKHHNGKMRFRIEDTDRARHSEEAVEAIINGLKWLGIDWDGDIISQYACGARHAEIAHELVKRGEAYYCYCTPEELDKMREEAKAAGRITFYDRRWRDSKETPPAGIKPVIRIKAPLTGERIVHDEVQGEVKVAAEQLDDFIIMRSDGVATYMLAVVVDDHDMGVTHVIRGDDHLNNTFRQNVIYEAMGWDIPVYAHLPLILGPDGAKLSKRHGATGVEEYRDLGYLPEAMRNYLLRLCWSHGDDEIISTEQAIEWFSLEGIGKSPARFDFDKLNFVNAHYLKIADNGRLVDLTMDILKRGGHPLSPHTEKYLLAAMDELKTRAKTLVGLAEDARIYWMTGDTITMDEKAAAQMDDAGKDVVRKIAEELKKLNDFTAAGIENTCKAFAEANGLKLGKVMMPLRAALTGTTSSPSLFHAIEILGVDEVLRRISKME